MSISAMANTAQALSESMTPKFAVSYLRVSTRGQAERGGGHDEGFSIPAQREANKKKAASLGAMVGKEFVDRGASAKSADRPQLQAMLEYVRENADRVDYVIVHKVDRLARNRDDDSDIMRVLRECGVQLVSASESIDETPSGMLLHGIMSSIAEFYSQNLATEVKKGMGEKVKGGGTEAEHHSVTSTCEELTIKDAKNAPSNLTQNELHSLNKLSKNTRPANGQLLVLPNIWPH